MLTMAATRTQKDSLRRPALFVHVPTHGARLRAVRGVHFDQSTARPQKLVTKHLNKHSPTGIHDSSVQAGFGFDVGAGVFNGAFGAADHVVNLQFLNDHGAVALGVAGAEGMQVLFALPPNSLMQQGDTSLGLFSVLGSFLPSSKYALGMGKTSLRQLEVLGIGRRFAVGVVQKIGNASVNAHDGFCPSSGRGHIDFAHQASKPLISVSLDGTCLGLAFDGTMQHDSHSAKLGKAKGVSIDSPLLWVRFTKSNRAAAPTFESGLAGQALETPPPGFFKLDKKLSAHVSQHIGEPRKLGAQVGKLFHLVERGGVSLIGSCKAHQPLLESEVPQEPQGSFPLPDASDLLLIRVNSEAKGLVNKHERSVAVSKNAFNKKGAALPPRPNWLGVCAQKSLDRTKAGEDPQFFVSPQRSDQWQI